MCPPDPILSIWAEVFIAAGGSLIGGFAATLLWWLAWRLFSRAQRRDAVEQKRNGITLEIAKIRAWLKLLKDDTNRTATTIPGRASGVLGALVRMGPDLTPGRSLEPQLGELEHRLGLVEAAAMRLFVATTGTATAMRGSKIEEELPQLPTILAAEVDKAMNALKKFEQALVVVPN